MAGDRDRVVGLVVVVTRPDGTPWLMVRSWFAARWKLVLVVGAALLILFLVAARDSSVSRPPETAPDSMIVTWDVKPLDLGYTLTLSSGARAEQEVHLPVGVTRYAWPLRTEHRTFADSVRLTACLERYRAEVSAVELGGCLDVFYHLPTPQPELRLEIRKVPR